MSSKGLPEAPSSSSASHVDAADAAHGSSEPPAPLLRRSSSERPCVKLTVRLIDTYKHINKVYYEARAKAKSLEESEGAPRGGTYNGGFDDQHYDYIIQAEEVFNGRYILKHKIGKGSFGQVVCAWDQEMQCDVAIKIIKSRQPFRVQAQTEIMLLTRINDKDEGDDCNLVRLLHQFTFRNHQCLVFEMLSYNLYELLKNTKFVGVSLNLIRKFSKQILKALKFLARPDVDVVHCDLKPENILLRHPRRSAIKLIDFGSSCLSSERKYTYIQSRFYRSPEILLGLPYDQKIDIWSLGCLLVEMHTGEPLFGGSDQVDQMCRVVEVLGMPPLAMIEASKPATRALFFERVELATVAESPPAKEVDMNFTVNIDSDGLAVYALRRPKSTDGATPPRQGSLAEIIGVNNGGPSGRRRDQEGHSEERYIEFLDFIQSLLIFDPVERFSARQALQHAYLTTDVAGDAAPSDAAPASASVTVSTAADNKKRSSQTDSGGEGQTTHQRTSDNATDGAKGDSGDTEIDDVQQHSSKK